MKLFANMLPFGSVAVLTVLAALPWGLPTEDRFFLPMLPVVAIHYWALRRHQALPEWSVFLAGLLLDVFTHGPLGYWPLIYLSAYTLGVLQVTAGRKSQLLRLALFAASLAVVATLGWAIASLFFFEIADWRPYARGASLAALGAIVIVPLLHILDAPEPSMDGQPLKRGG
jgi:rod shape-determining protein MreD